MGLSLLDFITGYDGLVVVDAVQTGQMPPGAMQEIDLESIQVLPATAPHFLGLGEIFALARELGLPMPSRVKIFAIEVGDAFTVSTRMTEPLQQALPSMVERILDALEEMARSR